MAETSRDFEQERLQAVIDEATKEGLVDLTKEELDYIIAEIEYYEACMSTSMDMGSVYDHAEACGIFDELNISEDRKKAITTFLNKALSN